MLWIDFPPLNPERRIQPRILRPQTLNPSREGRPLFIEPFSGHKDRDIASSSIGSVNNRGLIRHQKWGFPKMGDPNIVP